MNKTYRFGVLGAGSMGLAIADGAVHAGLFVPADILLFNRNAEKREQNRKNGYSVTDDLTEVYQTCEMVILGINPGSFDDVLPQLAACPVDEKPVLVSVAAGITFARIENVLGADTPVIRVMPNTPLILGQGASALVKNDAATDEQLAETDRLFAAMGVTAVFPHEDMLNEIIPFNGSLPAYVYQFVTAFVKSAMRHGIPQDAALSLICQTVIGSAELMRGGGKTPDELLREICTPNGTTVQGVAVFRAHNLDGIVAEACDQCIARAYELGR